jgi:ATP-dependent Clp protease ATP-binding subunit ClpC
LNSGAAAEESQYNRIRSLVNEELKQYFRPEFLNRLDEIIVFRQLTKDEVKEIAEIMLREVFARMQEKGIGLRSPRPSRSAWSKRATTPATGPVPSSRQ